MSNEVAVELEVEAPEALEFSPAQSEAMKHGWKPQDDWEGSEEDFISAPEFNRRAELFDKIARQSKEIKDVNAKFTQLAAFQSKVAEKAREEALDTLKQEKVQAYAEEDFEKVVELDEKIAKEREVPVESTVAPPNQDFDNWAANNDWYAQDQDLTELADAFGLAYSQKEAKKGRDVSTITTKEVLEYVDGRMKSQLPKEEVVQTPSPVEGASKSTSKRTGKSTKGKFSRKDLSEDQQSLMRGIMQADPDMTEAQYIEELVTIGELK